MSELLKLDHIQKYYGNEGAITKAINAFLSNTENFLELWVRPVLVRQPC